MTTYENHQCPQCGAGLPSLAEQVICQYCGARLMRKPLTDQPSPSGGESSTIVQGLRLQTIVCTDGQGIGGEAFRMLAPVGWTFQGGVHWTMANPGMPAVLSFQVRNPQGEEAFECFPALTFFWSSDPMSRVAFPQGSLYYGNQVQPPTTALQALRELAIPRFRSQHGPFEILSQEALPELPNQMRVLNPNAASGNMTAEGARIRIRIQRQDTLIDEIIFGVLQAQRMTMPALFGVLENTFWSLDFLFSYRALSERLDHLDDLFQTILHSFRLNLAWFNAYIQVSNQMIQGQIQHIQQIGQLSRYISQTSNQISDMIVDSYNQRQSTMDRLATGFSQAIRGVDAYFDPFAGRGIELPGGYEHAWANPLGEYIITDDPNFNPNLQSNQHWEPLKRQ